MSRRPLQARLPVQWAATVLTTVLALALLVPFGPARTAEASGSLPSDPGGSVVKLSVPRDLDRTGRTLPKTSYAIPDGAVFLATDGDDANSGTEDQPVRTLNRAITLADDGGTVVLRGGVYRDWFHNPDDTAYGIVTKSLTFQAYPGELPWLDGSDVIAADRWTRVGKLWRMSWSTPEYCDGQYYSRPLDQQLRTPNSGPCAHFDMSLDRSNRLAVDPQMAFVDDRSLHQATTLKKLPAGSFFYDHDRRLIYLAADPAKHTVELTRRPVAMVLGNRQTYRVLGLGFRKYASNEYGRLTSAALRILASTSLVENSVFTRNAAGGLAYSNPSPGTVVRRSVFATNGYTGLAANGASSSGQRNDLVVSDNVFSANNAEHFGTGCTLSCGQAAAKLAHMVGLTMVRNIVEKTRGAASGLWCDLDCTDTTNRVQPGAGQHRRPGIIYEVSDTGVIAANQVIGNKYGITVASANTKVYNNTLVDNRQGFRVYDDRRTPGVDGWNDIGPDTRNVELVNNVVSGPGYSLLAYPMRAKAKAPNTGAESLFSRVDHNTLHQTAGKKPSFVYWQTRAGKVSRFRAPVGIHEGPAVRHRRHLGGGQEGEAVREQDQGRPAGPGYRVRDVDRPAAGRGRRPRGAPGGVARTGCGSGSCRAAVRTARGRRPGCAGASGGVRWSSARSASSSKSSPSVETPGPAAARARQPAAFACTASSMPSTSTRSLNGARVSTRPFGLRRPIRSAARRALPSRESGETPFARSTRCRAARSSATSAVSSAISPAYGRRR